MVIGETGELFMMFLVVIVSITLVVFIQRWTAR